ncbi:MAG: hypothetical protein ACRDQ4_13625 [Pseudonocardiaceae bacterium]
MPDIADLVEEDLLNAAITSDEWLIESGTDVVKVAPLCWYHVRICAITKPQAHLAGPVRVVSEYPNIAAGFASAHWDNQFTQRTVHGAVEEYLPDLADVAVECVETGENVRRRGLVVMETLFEADVWLVCSQQVAQDTETVDRLRTWASAIAEPERSGCPSWPDAPAAPGRRKLLR